MKPEEAKKKKTAAVYRNPARYRLDFIKENTLSRVWSVRMTRTRVWLVSGAIVAATLALLWVVVAFTPLRQLLPGTLKGDLRARYVDTSMRLDSLEQAAAMNQAYLDNIRRIFEDEPVEAAESTAPTVDVTDSLLAASEAERQFVRSYEQEERFKLSVLAPIAAEGMVFSSPLPAMIPVKELAPAVGTKGVSATMAVAAPVSAVYRGTVISVSVGSNGRSSVVVQHPNDFISVYNGLGDVFVEKGTKVEAAQRIGNVPAKEPLFFELWHKGTPLSPEEFISF